MMSWSFGAVWQSEWEGQGTGLHYLSIPYYTQNLRQPMWGVCMGNLAQVRALADAGAVSILNTYVNQRRSTWCIS